MKTIEEIMSATECTKDQAMKLFDELTKLPSKLGEFISDNLDRVNAYNADEIEVIRHYGYSRHGANVIVGRLRADIILPLYDRAKYCFDVSDNYIGVSFY